MRRSPSVPVPLTIRFFLLFSFSAPQFEVLNHTSSGADFTAVYEALFSPTHCPCHRFNCCERNPDANISTSLLGSKNIFISGSWSHCHVCARNIPINRVPTHKQGCGQPIVKQAENKKVLLLAKRIASLACFRLKD